MPSIAVASRRETVDLPDPEGPSTATTHRSGRTARSTATSKTSDGQLPIVPGAPGSVADGLEEGAHLGVRQPAEAARAHVAEPDRADRRTDQARHRVPDLVHHPAHDVLAALVQGDLDLRGLAD